MSAIAVERLVKCYGSCTAVRDVSFEAGAGQVTALLGPNGAGKTTIIEILTGLLRPSSGTVRVLGADPRPGRRPGGWPGRGGRPGRAWRARLGVVLQSASVDPQLSVAEALRLYAGLYPRPLPVPEVLDVIGLAAEASARIGTLSGGQRRRVDLGLGIIGRPDLLFLDEPTTGLDPGLETRMMELLRGLADHSRAVVVVTHATKSLGLCTRILVMGRGGRLCFDGPPAEAMTFFEADSFDEIYAQLDRRPAEEWQRKRAQLGMQAVVPEQAPRPPASSSSPSARRRQGALMRQAYVLTHRYVRLFSRDRRNLIILMAQVPLLALAIVGLYKKKVFAHSDADDSVTVLFLITTIVVWFGSIDGAREIIKEKSVFVREAAVGVRTGAYLLSKAAVLFTLAAVQTLVLAAIVFFFQPLHEPTGAYVAMAVLIVLTGFASVGMGLLMSAAVRTQDQATSFIPLVLVPQLFFGGSIVPVATMSAPLAALSNAIVAKWSYAGLGSSIHLNGRIAASPAFAKVSKFGDSYFAIAPARVDLALIVFVGVFFTGIFFLLRRDS
ncbi:MAG TPA: ATP-binding cassette domain-containing protein [Solirubrobacteraceae bacterium]